MYPYLVPDGKSNLFVATSDGLSDRRGHLLWALKASGFTRLAPFQQSNHNITFFSYQHTNHIDSHGIDGKVLWGVKLDVSDVGSYETRKETSCRSR